MNGNLEQKVSEQGIAVNSSGEYSPVTVNVSNQVEINSLLKPVLLKLIDQCRPTYTQKEYKLPPDIEEKIKYNNVKIFKDDLKNTMNYIIIIEELIENINNEDDEAIDLFLWSINQRYLTARKKLFIESDIDPENEEQIMVCINSNADRIIELIKNEIEKDIQTIEGKNIELIRFSILLIVCYGFISCNILERPLNDIS